MDKQLIRITSKFVLINFLERAIKVLVITTLLWFMLSLVDITHPYSKILVVIAYLVPFIDLIYLDKLEGKIRDFVLKELRKNNGGIKDEHERSR